MISECFKGKKTRSPSLGRILDLIMQEVPSEFGAILLMDGKDQILDLEYRKRPQAEVDSLRFDVVKEALEYGNPVVSSYELSSTPYRSVCLPLFCDGKPMGGIYLTRKDGSETYSDQDIELLASFSRPVSLISRRNLNVGKLFKDSIPIVSPLVGRSKFLLQVLEFIDRVKDSDVPVFVSGESGTGKELVARTIHQSGRGKTGKFIAINCGAIPDHLLESELFGFVRGSFTGAIRDRLGLIEEANRGTFFLDEIGDLSPPLQAKLLRVVQEREVRRIGENRIRPVDVRFISATNKDIENEVREGHFREDLYYRLKIVSIDLSPLRKRKEDVLCLVNHLIERYCREMKRERVYFTPEAMKLLLDYSWPGNVRELQNEIQKCLILCGEDNLIKGSYLSSKIHERGEKSPSAVLDYFSAKAEFEKKFLSEALSRSGYNRTKTAEEIGISRQGLFKLMKKHSILTD